LSENTENQASGRKESSVGGDFTSNVIRRREVFWHNVIREILNALSAAAASGGRLKASPSGAAMSASPPDAIFDGRMAVITRFGQRIAIADVFPVFACSVPNTKGDRMLSGDVQCSVFQIRTPSGEVYTLPLHEIVAVHSLSEELLMRMEAAAEAVAEVDEGEGHPFGFAAYTSLARSEREAREAEASPEELDS
jgi:hypothetical protein